MFSIYTPQTIELQVKRPDVLDDKGAPVAAEASEGDFHGTLAFDHESSDVSKCRMVITRDDKVWTYTFNTHGLLVDSTYEDDESRKAKADAEEKAAEALAAQRAKEQADAKASAAHELKTADDTTAADKAWDASTAPAPPTSAGPNPFAPLQELHNAPAS